MSDLSAFLNIVSSTFDGKLTLDQANQRLGQLGQTVIGQVESGVQKVENLLGPEASADINAGLQDVQQALGGAVALADADLAPYLASGAKAVEGAVDTVLTVATKGGAAPLIPLVNGGIDQLAAGLKAAIDAQAAYWKAKLALNTIPPVPTQPA